jgi:hypothetical protein
MHSLYEVWKPVTDGRKARGKRYDVAGVLVVAKLAGMKSVVGASEWIEDQAPRLRAGLHLSWKRMPCANTYSDVLARLDRKPGECDAGGVAGAKGAPKAAVGRSRADWSHSRASDIFIWRWMAKP